MNDHLCVKSQSSALEGTVDVRCIRKQLGLSQSEFAARYGFSLGNVQNWEQGHRKPAGAARVLLTVIKNEPKAVDRALRNL
jgi:putative transcriptional regulator